MVSITIKNGSAPKPKRNKIRKYPWETLLVGQHFIVKPNGKQLPNVNSIRACSTHAGKKLGREFSVHELDDGIVTVERTL